MYCFTALTLLFHFNKARPFPAEEAKVLPISTTVGRNFYSIYWIPCLVPVPAHRDGSPPAFPLFLHTANPRSNVQH